MTNIVMVSPLIVISVMKGLKHGKEAEDHSDGRTFKRAPIQNASIRLGISSILDAVTIQGNKNIPQLLARIVFRYAVPKDQTKQCKSPYFPSA